MFPPGLFKRIQLLETNRLSTTVPIVISLKPEILKPFELWPDNRLVNIDNIIETIESVVPESK